MGIAPRGLTILAILGLLSACRLAQAPSPSPTPSPTAAATLTPLPTASPTPVTDSIAARPSAAPGGAGTLSDPAGDLVDGAGQATISPIYADLIEVMALTDATNLNLTISLAGSPPDADPVQETLVIGTYIDTNADGDPEYDLLVSNIAERGAYSASLVNLNSGETLAGADFPGSASLTGSVVDARVALAAIGGAAGVEVAAYTEWTYYPDPVNHPNSSEKAFDGAPEPTWPADGSSWLASGPE